MYCKNCGAEIDKNAYVCPKCGIKVNKANPDVPSVGFNILAILFPIVGLILYFTWKNETPNKAKSILTCAIIGWALGMLSYILSR